MSIDGNMQVNWFSLYLYDKCRINNSYHYRVVNGEGVLITIN